jgi:outer membrane protein insertion porin family
VRRNYSISFNEPGLFDGPWSLGFSVYNALREYDEYDRKSIGGQLTLGRSLGEYVRGYVTTKHETVTVSNIDDTASNYIKEQEGRATTNSLRLSLVRDTRDNFLSPTRGNRSSLGGEYAGGPLGGDNSFTKIEAEHSFYTPLPLSLVGMLHAEYGTVHGFSGHEVPIYEKFFLGGITSLRGFPYREVGPKDENGDPKGGTQQLYFNAELILPLVPEQGFNLVVFYDTGNAWDEGDAVSLTDLRESAGVGVRWMSPIGPFRLEWGYILDRQDGEPRSDWSFIIGNFF